jgi:multiple sugar transport system substrate-binding protein
MRMRYGAVAFAAILMVSACSNQGSGGSGAPGASGSASGGASQSAGGGSGFDPNSVEGTVVFSGWQASPEEGEILQKLFDDFQAKYPNIKIDYQPVAAEYPAAMLAKFSAGEPPDLFYVDSSVAPEWIDQGVLQELDSMASERGFDTSQFYEGYLNAFKGTDGKTYGFPKDGNTLGMAYNEKMLTDAGIEPPTNWEELKAAAEKLTSGDTKAFCLNHSLDRALAFIYQNGGGLLTEDKTGSMIDTPESKEAIQWYLDYFTNEQGARAVDLGDDWCGKALGEEQVAIIFEGGWLDPYMKSNYPDVKYAWAPMPEGKQKATLGFTVSYSIGVDSKNKDAAWVLLTYLTGPEGMKTWTEGGVANPSRKDVPAAAGKEILVEGAEYAKPWSFIPGFSKINDAFNNAMTAAIEGSGTADDVATQTKAAIDEALAAQ